MINFMRNLNVAVERNTKYTYPNPFVAHISYLIGHSVYAKVTQVCCCKAYYTTYAKLCSL